MKIHPLIMKIHPLIMKIHPLIMKIRPLSEKQINIIFKVIFSVIFSFLCINVLFSLLVSFLPVKINFTLILIDKFANFPTPLRVGLINIIDKISAINNALSTISDESISSMFKTSMFFIVISGLILIILNNIDILKSVIKNSGLNRIFKSVREKETNIENPVSIPRYLNIFFVVLSILLVVLFFIQYFSHTVYVQQESYVTFPLQMKAGSEILKQCIPTIFNLDNFEGGMYRPRVLSFLVDYININALPVLNRLFPFWGMRLVLTVLAILLTVVAMYVLLNDFFRTMPVGIKSFLSVFPIYFITFQAFLPFFYRTSKYLVIPLGLFILRYFLKNYEISFTKRGIPKGLLAWILLSLSTLYDEQLLAIIVFFFCLSLLYSLISKKLYANTVVSASALIFYLFWYFCLGKYLFSIFTPHPKMEFTIHSYRSLLSIFNPQSFYDAIIYYINLINLNSKAALPILCFFLGFSLVNKNIAGKAKMFLIAIPVLLLSFLLVCAVYYGHPGPSQIPEFNLMNYFAPALFLFYFVSIYFSFNIFYFLPYKKIFAGIILLFLLTIVVDNHYHKNEYYSAAMVKVISPGFQAPVDAKDLNYNHKRFDQIVMEKNIKMKHIHARDYRLKINY